MFLIVSNSKSNAWRAHVLWFVNKCVYSCRKWSNCHFKMKLRIVSCIDWASDLRNVRGCEITIFLILLPRTAHDASSKNPINSFVIHQHRLIDVQYSWRVEQQQSNNCWRKETKYPNLNESLLSFENTSNIVLQQIVNILDIRNQSRMWFSHLFGSLIFAVRSIEKKIKL